eukprot:254104-Amphidinium_carterae.1
MRANADSKRAALSGGCGTGGVTPIKGPNPEPTSIPGPNRGAPPGAPKGPSNSCHKSANAASRLPPGPGAAALSAAAASGNAFSAIAGLARRANKGAARGFGLALAFGIALPLGGIESL